jgi:hypothetical protein
MYGMGSGPSLGGDILGNKAVAQEQDIHGACT